MDARFFAFLLEVTITTEVTSALAAGSVAMVDV